MTTPPKESSAAQDAKPALATDVVGSPASAAGPESTPQVETPSASDGQVAVPHDASLPPAAVDKFVRCRYCSLTVRESRECWNVATSLKCHNLPVATNASRVKVDTPRTCLKCGGSFPDSCVCAIPVFPEQQHKTCPNCGAFGMVDGPLERELAACQAELRAAERSLDFRTRQHAYSDAAFEAERTAREFAEGLLRATPDDRVSIWQQRAEAAEARQEHDALIQAERKKVIHCENCGDSWYDSGMTASCPHCALEACQAELRAERKAREEAEEKLDIARVDLTQMRQIKDAAEAAERENVELRGHAEAMANRLLAFSENDSYLRAYEQWKESGR